MAQMIGEHGLYCPDPQDYAAYALYMQDVGTRIDEQLFAQQTALQFFLEQPTILVTNSAAVVIPVGPAEVVNIFDTVVFNNSTFMSLDVANTRIDIGSALGTPTVVPYLRGAYTAGFNVRMTAAVVTAGTHRTASLLVTNEELLFVAATAASATDSATDQNTGGDEALFCRTNFPLSGTSGVNVEFAAISFETAGTVTIPAGGAFGYVTWNGATDIIEVA